MKPCADCTHDLERHGAQEGMCLDCECSGWSAQPPTVIDGRCGDDMCEYKGSYYMGVRCTNCGLEGEIRCTKGHEGGQTARSKRCPRCDCNKLTAGTYLRDGEDGEPEEDEDAPSS